MKFNFVSWDQFNQDIQDWERKLPYFDAVCGIPRSGMPVASYIALRRNIRLVSLPEVLNNPSGCIASAPLRSSNPIVKNRKPYGNRLLIVDDSSSDDSVTVNGLRKRLADQQCLNISYGAVYRASERSNIDFFYKEVPQPRLFGWNWYRHWNLQHAYLDIDGVLCEDWKGRPEQDEDTEFVQHLENVAPLYIPDVPVFGLVTSRLERYRPQTENWLRRHGVKYARLIMHPAETPEARRAAHDHAERKAAAYAKASKARLFVESDVRQARKIHEISGKSVLCIDTMEMFK